MRAAAAGYRKQIEGAIEVAFETLDRRRWLAGTLLLALAARLSPRGIPNDGLLTPYSAVWVFAGLAATSVALLALRYAITTFRGQQFALRLPPTFVKELFESQEHHASSWRLIAVFITSLSTLGPIDQSRLPPSALTVAMIDVLLLLITLKSIARDSQRVFDPDYSRIVADLVVRRLGDDYLGNQHERGWSFPPPSLTAGVATDRPDPFALIEEVCVRAMAENDLTTARLVLRHVVGRVLGYLDGRESVARGVLGWLGEVMSVVGRRALLLDERSAELVVLLFEDIINWALERRAQSLRWHDRIELLKSFRELRHASIQEGKTEALAEGLYTLGRTFKKALETAPPEDQIWELHVRDQSPPHHNTDIDS